MSEYLEKSGGRGYVERTKEEFDRLLVERLKFRIIPLEGIHEVVYQRDGKDGDYAVRVYSSLQNGTGRTRDCGEDAIRVLMFNLLTGYPMKIMGESKTSKTGKRINRTKGAMKNLERRVKQYLLMGVDKNRCPQCGGMMAIRKGKHGKFLGCTVRTDGEWCKGKRMLPGWID